MTLLDRIKERTGTDLSDSELAAMIAGIGAELAARYGELGQLETVLGDPSDRERWKQTLTLPRPLDKTQPATVVEMEPGNTGQAGHDVTLDQSDYRVLHGGRTLQRLTGGPNGHAFWAPMVRVVYWPMGDQAARDELTIKLMQLDLSYRGGLKSERAGDYQFTLGADAAQEREKLLASLSAGNRMTMA